MVAPVSVLLQVPRNYCVPAVEMQRANRQNRIKKKALLSAETCLSVHNAPLMPDTIAIKQVNANTRGETDVSPHLHMRAGKRAMMLARPLMRMLLVDFLHPRVAYSPAKATRSCKPRRTSALLLRCRFLRRPALLKSRDDVGLALGAEHTLRLRGLCFGCPRLWRDSLARESVIAGREVAPY